MRSRPLTIFAAPVPVTLGGLGVSCAHDLVVASSRLARGDASVAIGVNMHLVAELNMELRAPPAPRDSQSPTETTHITPPPLRRPAGSLLLTRPVR
jgi:hypothetical protein